jgi:multiple sugar transport system permease protein
MTITLSQGKTTVLAKGTRAAWRAILYLVATAWGVSFLFPFFWTIASSLKQPSEIYAFPPVWIPSVLKWSNYVQVFNIAPFLSWFANSVYVVSLSTLGVVVSSTVVGYSLARFDYRGRDILFIITLSTMMIPAQVTLIPQYLLFHRLGWVNSFRPLWIPMWFGGGAFNIFLMRQFIMTLPRDLDEAAIIDGANPLRIFANIIVPLCKPVIATAAVISFISAWNAFIGPLVYLNEREKFTLALGLDALRTTSTGDTKGIPTFHFLMAGCVMATIPPMALFFSVQRLFVRGIVMSGIKG